MFIIIKLFKVSSKIVVSYRDLDMKMRNKKMCFWPIPRVYAAGATDLQLGSSLITAKWKLHWQTFKYIQVTYTYKVNKRKWRCLSSEGISRKHCFLLKKKKIKKSQIFNKNTNFNIISRFVIVQDFKNLSWDLISERQYVKSFDKQQNV